MTDATKVFEKKKRWMGGEGRKRIRLAFELVDHARVGFLSFKTIKKREGQ